MFWFTHVYERVYMCVHELIIVTPLDLIHSFGIEDHPDTSIFFKFILNTLYEFTGKNELF